DRQRYDRPGRHWLHPAGREQRRYGQQRGLHPARHGEQRVRPARPLGRFAMTTTLETATAEWSLWSVTARIVVTRPETVSAARARAGASQAEGGRACSRFRPASELVLAQLAAANGVAISPLLADLVEAGLDAARVTDGAVDPTVAGLLDALGYDRDISALEQA